MPTRATVRLDEPSRRVAKTLAIKRNVSPSEAVRRALIHYREEVLGVPAEARRRRTAALDRLFLFGRSLEGFKGAQEGSIFR